MLQHRCPWCGEIILNKLPRKLEPGRYFKQDVCVFCKRPYRKHINWVNILLLGIGLFLTEFIRIVFIRDDVSSPSWPFLVMDFILILYIFIKLYRFPFSRYIKQGRRNSQIHRKKASVSILWSSYKNDGLLVPRFHMEDGEIFPACFMDAEGTPISTAYCISLQKIHWKGIHRCTCQISLVLDEAPEDKLFVKGNTFKLYHNYRIIATGTI